MEETGRHWTPLAVVLVVIAVLFAIVGIIYLTVPTNHLPVFIPGKPSDKVIHAKYFHARHYTKRAIAMFAFAIVAAIGAWYAAGVDRRVRY